MNTGIKKNDILLIFIVLAVAGLAYFLHSVIEGVYSLGEDQEIVINEGTNYLVIKNGKADMTKADCPDKLCVNQKAVSKKHESIICLPNKVIVEVNSGEKGEYDAVAN